MLEREDLLMPSSRFIGEIAKAAGLSVKAVRYYESLGLLLPPGRTEAGYRTYSEADLERLRFIQGAKSLGLSLAEIKEIVEAWQAGAAPCGHVEAHLAEKVAALDRRIEELTRFRDGLAGYLRGLEGTSASGAPCKHVEGALAGRFGLAPPEAGRPGDGG